MSWTHPLHSLAAWAARILPLPVKNFLYQFKPLARLIRGALNLSAPHGLTTVQVAAGGLAGMRLSLDMQSEKDFWLGTYEPELQQAIHDWLNPGMVVYDVGANIGYISLLMARRVSERGRVFAFEALPANLERLYENLRLNNMEGRIQVVGGAVVDQNRSIQFHVGPSHGMGKAAGSAGREVGEVSDFVEVSGISLDTFVYHNGNPAPQVVKIDIEGGEVLALPGMRRLLGEQKPILILEIHGTKAAKVVWEILIEAGYRMHHLKKGYPEIHSPGILSWKSYVLSRFPGEE